VKKEWKKSSEGVARKENKKEDGGNEMNERGIKKRKVGRKVSGRSRVLVARSKFQL